MVLALDDYYWSAGGPVGRTREDFAGWIKGDWKTALAKYYRNYAYERAGSPSSWARYAHEVLLDYPGDSPADDLSGWAWHQFQVRIQKPSGLNPKNNPLFPEQPDRLPMTGFVHQLASDDFNLFKWAKRLLSQGRTDEATTCLLAVHAVGPKIAAFFLRDVVAGSGMAEAVISDVHLIQPIDVWVRRAIVELTGDRELAKPTRDRESAKRMVQLAGELDVAGAALNAALWVLGARLARTAEHLHRALDDRDCFSRLVAGEVDRTRGNLDALYGSLGAFI